MNKIHQPYEAHIPYHLQVTTVPSFLKRSLTVISFFQAPFMKIQAHKAVKSSADFVILPCAYFVMLLLCAVLHLDSHVQ